jgi:hypothetical protein
MLLLHFYLRCCSFYEICWRCIWLCVLLFNEVLAQLFIMTLNADERVVLGKVVFDAALRSKLLVRS